MMVMLSVKISIIIHLLLFYIIKIFAGEIESDSLRSKRGITDELAAQWPEGKIPYVIDTNTFNNSDVKILLKAMSTWENETCIKFQTKTKSDEYWINIIGGEGCYTDRIGCLFKKGQIVSLMHKNCSYLGLHLHELGHVIGLEHEHIRDDRDNFIIIHEDRIINEFLDQFKKSDEMFINKHGTPFDVQSIMLYGPNAGGINETDVTIEAVKPRHRKALVSPKYKDLSFWDVKAINRYYKCNKNCSTATKCKYPSYQDKNCICQSQEDFIKRRCINEIADHHCIRKARKGFCFSNTYFMGMYCRKACNFCYQNKWKDTGIFTTLSL